MLLLPLLLDHDVSFCFSLGKSNVIPNLLGVLGCYYWLHFVSNLGAPVPYLPLRTVPACHIRDQFELTGGSSGHVSVDFPQNGGREME